MKSMPTGFFKRYNDCLSGHWKGVNFDIFVVEKEKYNIILMSIESWLLVSEGKKMNNKYQKERCTNSSLHNPFRVTNL